VCCGSAGHSHKSVTEGSWCRARWRPRVDGSKSERREGLGGAPAGLGEEEESSGERSRAVLLNT
jgi:hypothetical protein